MKTSVPKKNKRLGRLLDCEASGRGKIIYINPITATAAGVGALAINLGEAGANSYLNYRDERWRRENAARAAALIHGAVQKIRELNDELIQGGCNSCLGNKVR